MDVELAKPFVKAAVDVIGTMAFITPRAGKPFVKKNTIATGDVTGLVGLTGDGKRGSVSISFQKSCAVAMLVQNPMSSYSKGAQGLSVFPRVTGIFTRISISLSLWLRQRGDRYAIRAGRNLPDKEFRYLRTVIVTAAVYWGFGLRLRIAANLTP